MLPRLTGPAGVELVYGGPDVKWRRSGRWWARPCPLHNGNGLNFHVDTQTLGWRCHSGCQTPGDAVTFLQRTRGLDFPGAVRHLAELARVPFPDASSGSRSVRVRYPAARPVARQERPQEPAKRPPAGEVAALWEACRPVTEATGAELAFLTGRGWAEHLEVVDFLDVARLLPTSYSWPAWWPERWARGYRLVMPAYEADGALASLHARWVLPDEARRYTDKDGELQELPKTRWPLGCQSKELLFACPHALQVLRGVDVPGLRAVLVVEGLTGTLNLAVRVYHLADELGTVAVLGATSGGFEALARVRWPSGVEAWVGTDADGAGAKYADKVNSALAPRGVKVARVTWAAAVDE